MASAESMGSRAHLQQNTHHNHEVLNIRQTEHKRQQKQYMIKTEFLAPRSHMHRATTPRTSRKRTLYQGSRGPQPLTWRQSSRLQGSLPRETSETKNGRPHTTPNDRSEPKKKQRAKGGNVIRSTSYMLLRCIQGSEQTCCCGEGPCSDVLYRYLSSF